MKVIVVLVLCLSLFVAIDYALPNAQGVFNSYIRAFGKPYNAGTPEYGTRFNNFLANLEEAAILSIVNPQAHFGPSVFSDLSKDEFRQYLTGAAKPKEYEIRRSGREVRNLTSFDKPHHMFRSNIQARAPNPTTYDWCEAGVITPVNDQGGCGSCWAFSAMETVESYHALRSGSLVALSAEQIVDCDNGRGDYGCGGGWPYVAYEYIQAQGGLESAASYPYTATYGSSGSCQFNGAVVTSVANWASISGGEGGLYNWVSSPSGGPISVCVAASTWQNYQGGILSSCDTYTDHCVQLTGYENWGSQSVWRIRNQWGTYWGEDGFMRILVGQNLCNIGSYGTVVATSN